MATTPAQEQAILALKHPQPRQITPLEMMSQVLQTQNPKDAVEVVKELAKLQMEMRRQDAEEAFNTAFNLCQREIRIVVPDAQGQNGKFASFKALDAEVRPIYSKYEFALSFNTASSSVPDQMIVLCHVSRGLHTRLYQTPMDISGVGAKGTGVMDKPKAIGAGLSYAKRYLLAAIWNIPIGEEGVLADDALLKAIDNITKAADAAELNQHYKAAYAMYQDSPAAIKVIVEARLNKQRKFQGANNVSR